MRPIFSDQLKARLVESLQKKQVSAYSAFTATALGMKLEMSAGNRTVMHREKCGYMVLTEVATTNAPSPATNSSDAQSPSIEFAMFKNGRPARPVLRNMVPTTAADDLNAAMQTGMDKVAAEISKFLAK